MDNRDSKGRFVKGVVFSEEFKNKLKIARRERKLSEEAKEKIRQKAIGRPSPMKGKKFTP